MGAGEEYSKYSRFCLFSLFFLYIFQDWTETLSVLRREDLFLLQHLTGISFQGLYSEMFSDSELILKGSFTGIQPSTELVILLFLIRKGVVLFQLWRHLPPSLFPTCWLLLLLKSTVFVGTGWADANCCSLKPELQSNISSFYEGPHPLMSIFNPFAPAEVGKAAPAHPGPAGSLWIMCFKAAALILTLWPAACLSDLPDIQHWADVPFFSMKWCSWWASWD